MSTAQSTPTATKEKRDREAIASLFRALLPDPGLVTAVTRAYVEERAQENIEHASAAWLTDWLQRREEWMGRIGQLLPAAKMVEISPTMKSVAAVHKARGEGRLIGFEVGDRVYYPAFQLRRDGTPAPWVRDVVAAVPDSDTLLQIFAAGLTAHGGRCYAELLNEGDEKIAAEVVKYARDIAAAEAR